VRDVSLTVQRGEVAGLLGPNGAGKTTCFYMITGLIPADSGSIWLDGEDITKQPMYQRARMGLGYLAQEASIFRGMTVEQNIKAVVELRESGKGIETETPGCWKNCISTICVTPRPRACRAASGVGSRSRVRWRAARPSCCWTNPSPASTPWPSPTSVR
jgi:ABC-type lipopolysaccharide export system ATPase subunit